MIKSYLYDVDNYINFLFYGIDIESCFSINERISAYRQKYNRLEKQIITNDLYTKSTSYILFNAFYSCLKQNSSLISYMNEDKLMLIDKLFALKNYDRMKYSNCISISFIEIVLEDNDKWNDIKNNVYNLLLNFKNYIHDDSNGTHRILSFDINLIPYDSSSYEPDVTNYNIDVISSYLDIIEDNYNLLSDHVNFYNLFDLEINNFLNNDINYFHKEGNIDFTIDNKLFDNKYLSKRYLDLVYNIHENNIELLIKYQYKIFEFFFKNYNYFKDDYMTNRVLYTFVSFDIILYNKIRYLIKDMNKLEKIFATYNYLIIRLQDILDELGSNINKKTFVFMYKNQLYKTRNKIQERMNNNG